MKSRNFEDDRLVHASREATHIDIGKPILSYKHIYISALTYHQIVIFKSRIRLAFSFISLTPILYP